MERNALLHSVIDVNWKHIKKGNSISFWISFDDHQKFDVTVLTVYIRTITFMPEIKTTTSHTVFMLKELRDDQERCI